MHLLCEHLLSQVTGGNAVVPDPHAEMTEPAGLRLDVQAICNGRRFPDTVDHDRLWPL